MSSNKNAKNKLIELYGAECFIEKLHLRPDKQKVRYTGKGQMQKMKELTYHHILEKRNRRKGNGRKSEHCYQLKIINGLINRHLMFRRN